MKSRIQHLTFAFSIQEVYLNDHIELSRTLPFASGTAMARGVLDSLMSATYFNASLLKLLRLWCEMAAWPQASLA